jgi:RimJ/RimL family protein N-acetyltransferase
MKVTGRRLVIRSIEQVDLPKLCEWRNSDDFLRLCTNKRKKVSLEQFGFEINNDLKKDRFLQVMVLTKNGDHVGTLYAYRYIRADGTIYVTTYIDPEYRHYNYGVEALSLFVKYLFESIGIFKVYVEVYSYNESVIRMLKLAGFVEEGCFNKHRNLNGKRYDMYVLAFYKSNLDTPSVKRLLSRFEL